MENESPRGHEAILLVEDDEGIRLLVRLMLESCGYTVFSAAGGQEALSYCEKHDVAMIVTDIMMPKMTGDELVGRVKELRPDVKTLFLSGYTRNAVSRQGMIDHGSAFLEKPFSAHLLACKVREVLDQ